MRVLARIGLLLFPPCRFLHDEFIEERTIVIEVESETCVLAPPGERAEPLARGAPVGTHRLARFVRAYPRGEIIKFVAAGQDRRQTNDTAFACVRAPKQTLHEGFISDLAFARADHMAFVENDQADIVDQRRVASQREVELLGRRDDDFAGAQCVFIASRKATGAVKGGDTEAERRECLPEGSLGLRRQGTQRRDDQYSARR